MLLQTPSEQTRLLQEIPKVIAEKIVPEPAKEATPEPEPELKEKIVPEPAKDNYLCFDSDAEDDDWFDSFLKIAEESRAKLSTENGTTTTEDPAPALEPEFPAAEDQAQQENTIDECDALTPPKVFINDQLIFPGTDITAESLEANSSLPKLDGKLPSPFANLKVSVPDLESSVDLVADDHPKHETVVSNGRHGIPAVIELSDDEDEECTSTTTSSLFCDQPDSQIWRYMDPQGAVQGPFSLSVMKRWADANYFPPGFMIWKNGTPDVKYPLAEVLRQSFSNNIRSCRS